MKLYEHEGKTLFARAGIPVPEGAVATDIQGALKTAQKIGYPVMVKALALQGGRKKAGGIAHAGDPDALTETIQTVLQKQIGEEAIEEVLVEQQLPMAHELYAGITFDAINQTPVLMMSGQGGIEVETLAADQPESVVKLPLDPLKPLWMHRVLAVAKTVGLGGRPLIQAADIAFKLAACYYKYDAITAEINPLVIRTDGEAYAADAKIEIDDAALFRQPGIRAFYRSQEMGDPLEAEARNAGISYVRLNQNGNVGLISGGAGLGMATMDAIYHHGGIPANFLDLGHATPEKTTAAMKIVLKTPGVAGVFVNAYGGMNNCGEIGEGIIKGMNTVQQAQPVVVKMRGHSQERGWRLLAERGIPVIKYGTTGEGIRLLMTEIEKRGYGNRGDSDRSE